MPGRTVQRDRSGRQAVFPLAEACKKGAARPSLGPQTPGEARRARFARGLPDAFPLAEACKKGAAPPAGAAPFCRYSPAIKYREYPPSCITSVGSSEPSCRVVTLTAAGPLCSPTVTV